MQPSGYMYLLNPENGNLVNAQTGKDVESISWEDLVKGVKKIVIGIDGRLIYAPAAENAIIPFQEWLAKEHPEVELSLHSGRTDHLKLATQTDIILEACAYGLYVGMSPVGSFKSGKIAKFTRIDEGESDITIHVDKNREGGPFSIKESPCSSEAMNIPLGKSETMTEKEKDNICKDIGKTMEDIIRRRREGKSTELDEQLLADKQRLLRSTLEVNPELIKSGHPLINQHFTAGISPGRFYMMGAYTTENKSMLVTADELNYRLNKNIGFNGRSMKVFVGFGNHDDAKANTAASLELGKAMPDIAGVNWIGVEDVKDADVGLVFKDNWWHIVKARGCHELMGKLLITKKQLMETAKDVNVEDAYPKADNAQLPKRDRTNTYSIDWQEATHGILIIMDVQKNMGSSDTELNREMLGRLTDSIFSKNLNQYVMIKGDTDGDYETRLAEAINNVSCVVNICSGEAEIEKFRELPHLVNTEVW